MSQKQYEFTLDRTDHYWSLRPRGYEYQDEFAIEVRIKYDHSPCEEFKVVVYRDGDMTELMTLNQYKDRISDMVKFEYTSEKDATRFLSNLVTLAEPNGLPCKSVLEQAKIRWNALKLIVNPRIAS
jgi:hypothetical protein